MKDFNDLLTETTDSFKKSPYAGHSTRTFDGIETRFEKCGNLKSTINDICQQLADQIYDEVKTRQNITHLGFSDVRLSMGLKDDENDDEFIECDVWEQVDTTKERENS